MDEGGGATPQVSVGAWLVTTLRVSHAVPIYPLGPEGGWVSCPIFPTAFGKPGEPSPGFGTSGGGVQSGRQGGKGTKGKISNSLGVMSGLLLLHNELSKT